MRSTRNLRAKESDAVEEMEQKLRSQSQRDLKMGILNDFGFLIWRLKRGEKKENKLKDEMEEPVKEIKALEGEFKGMKGWRGIPGFDGHF